jgi:hypothetical protein
MVDKRLVVLSKVESHRFEKDCNDWDARIGQYHLT